MSTAYLGGRYIPPIPVFPIRFRLLADTTATELLTAIIDTGPDMTIAPAHILLDLQAQAVQETVLTSQWGDVYPVTLYIVDLELAGQVFPGILVAGDESTEEVILGRNFLNLLPLFLDGPQQQVHWLSDATVRRLRSQKSISI